MNSSFSADLDISIGSFASFETVTPSVTPSTTPKTKRGRRKPSKGKTAAHSPRSIFKKPTQPNRRPKGPIVGTCEICGKSYRAKKYLEDHKLRHKMKDVASKLPTKEKMMEVKDVLILQALEAIACTPVVGKWGEQIHELVKKLCQHQQYQLDEYSFLSEVYLKFVDVFDEKKTCLPSILFKSLQDVVDEILSDVSCRMSVRESFKKSNPHLENPSVDTFVVEFVFTLSDKLLHFVRVCIEDEIRQVPQVSVSAEQRQIIHYISGSIIRQFLRKARQYKGNSIWIAIKDTILHCILEGEVVVAASSDRMWTEFLNRGALCFVGAKFLDFISSLVNVINAVKRPDGSVFHEDVQEQLLNSTCSKLWDDLIGSRLSEKQSISFMRAVVRSFTCTDGKGVSLRLMNHHFVKPVASVTLRQQLVPK